MHLTPAEPQLMQYPLRILIAFQRGFHRRWPTYKDLAISAPSRLRDFCQQSFCDPAFPHIRPFGWLTHRVHCLESTGKFFLERIKLFPEQQVLVGIGGIYKRDFRPVLWILQDTPRELVDWCNARPARDEGYMGRGVRLPLVTSQRGSKKESVTRLQRVEVTALLAVRVVFDEELEFAGFLQRGDGCVRARHRRPAAFWPGCGQDCGYMIVSLVRCSSSDGLACQ